MHASFGSTIHLPSRMLAHRICLLMHDNYPCSTLVHVTICLITTVFLNTTNTQLRLVGEPKLHTEGRVHKALPLLLIHNVGRIVVQDLEILRI